MNTELHAEFTIRYIVDAMLPTFSDPELGLHIYLEMSMEDLGYGGDGNTLVRRPKREMRILHFLFMRPSNYTKVYLYQVSQDAKGWNRNPLYINEAQQWTEICDHDSCWADAVGSTIYKASNDLWSKFEKRKQGDRPFTPNDVSIRNWFNNQPMYVRILNRDRVNPKAERYTPEGREYMVKFSELGFHDLVCVKTPNEKEIGQKGLMIRGGEYERQVVAIYERIKASSERVK